MKLFLVIIANLLLSNLLHGQTYYDAMRLKKSYDTTTKTIFIDSNSVPILKKYFNINNFTADRANALKNPFLKFSSKPTSGDNDKSSLLPAAGGGIFSGIGSETITNFADGLAKFLVARTKEELTIAFFTRLRKDLGDEKYAALQTLFPLTFHQLDLIGDKIYQFSIYLADLRNAFCSDLNNITTTIPYVLTLPQYQDYFSEHPWVSGIIQTGMAIGSSLSQPGENSIKLSDIITEVKDDADTYFPLNGANPASATINGAVKTMELISTSLISDDGKRAWITGDEFRKLTSDDGVFKIYLGLIYQKAKTGKIVFANGYALTNVLDSMVLKTQVIRNTLAGLAQQLNIYDNELSVLDTMAMANTERGIHTYALFNAGTDIVLRGITFIKSIDDKANLSSKAAGLFAKLDDYATAMHDISNVCIGINQKRYASAISSAVDFFSVVLKDKPGKYNHVMKFVQRLSTYGTFIAQVANAKSSNEVDSIIQQTALPAGSSYIKKHARFNIALQAYTGLYGGVQRQATDTKSVGAAGVYAPAGIAFSWGLPRKNIHLEPYSFSIFASIIDVGPLVSFRFSNANDTIANTVKVRLSQIVSPGVHLVYGLPNLPISFGVGCNWAPLITDVEKDAITLNSKNAFRAQVFIAVDIPLLNFHNNPR